MKYQNIITKFEKLYTEFRSYSLLNKATFLASCAAIMGFIYGILTILFYVISIFFWENSFLSFVDNKLEQRKIQNIQNSSTFDNEIEYNIEKIDLHPPSRTESFSSEEKRIDYQIKIDSGNALPSESPKIIATCLIMASQNYGIAPAILAGMYKLIGGKIGKEYGPNIDNSFDLGPMKINTSLLAELSNEWNLSEDRARELVRDNPCVNVNVAAWKFRRHLNETLSLSKAIKLYNEGTDRGNEEFKKQMLLIMKENGLLKTEN